MSWPRFVSNRQFTDRCKQDIEPKTKRFGQSLNHVKGGVASSSFHAADVRAVEHCPIGEFVLAQAKQDAVLPYGGTEVARYVHTCYVTDKV